MELKSKVLALYLRLSVEDEEEGESNSIANQRLLLEDYICQYDNLASYERIEFIDDGYSGTNGKRPGFQEMIRAVKNCYIHGIIVKDFSRFSRDYIELGNYMEVVFPLFEIRFLSINDHYDSKKIDLTQNGLGVAFQGILYDMYSKDISNKIKTSKEQYRKQGKLSGGSHPYGYVKSKSNNQIYAIDQEAASVVQSIFRLALENKTNIEIARILNEKHILTPALYKQSQGHYAYGLKNREIAVWDGSKVSRILREERYTGVFIGGQYESGGIGSGKTIKTPSEKWVKKDNTHPAIVSKEDFLSVQELKGVCKKRKRGKKEPHFFPNRTLAGRDIPDKTP